MDHTGNLTEAWDFIKDVVEGYRAGTIKNRDREPRTHG